MDIEELTWREQEILALLAKRFTNREIAIQLHLAESTVKDYVSNILGKLYVKNRRQAVERGKELGLFEAATKEKAEAAAKLPSFPSPFIGRLKEIDTIKLQLTKTRLLTISGPGGVGKTRLAIQVAKEILDNFEDGTFLVLLAPIRSSDHIVQALAEALGFPLATSEEPIQQLIRYLHNKRILLVIDNFEHLLEGAPIIEEILQYAPNVKILVTSRERLNLQGEVNYVVRGMEIPGGLGFEHIPSSDAIDLFIQHANRSRPSFNPSPVERRTIAAICKTIEGLPLAIELAAAWLNVLSLNEIKKEIEQSFDILSSETGVVPERHRSIRAVFEHSWSMLEPNDQELFASISVFLGGFTREAAQQIAHANLSALSRLVNKSVIHYDPETGRFQIHELLRQYAQEQLKSQPKKQQSVLEFHATYYAEFMHKKWEQLRDNRQIEALKEIDADIENIRAAWRYFVEQSNPVRIKQFLNSFWLVYWIRGWNLGAVRLFESAVVSLRENHHQKVARIVQAHAMANQAFFLTWLGQAEEGYRLAIKSVEILEQHSDPIALYFAYYGLSLPAYYLAKADEEKEADIQMLKIAKSLEDKWMIALGYFALSVFTLRTNDLPEAERLARISFDESKAIRDLTGQSLSLETLGHLANWRGDYSTAKEYYQNSLQASSILGFRWAIGNNTKYLGQVALRMEAFAAAESYFLQSLKIANDLGLDREIANLFYEIASLRVAQDRMEEAIEMLGLLMELPTSSQEHFESGRIKENAEKLLASLEGNISAQAISELLKQGRELDTGDFISSLLRSGKAVV